MFNFAKKNVGITYGAIIDIGSESVGVGILESDQSKQLPKIIYSHREHIHNTSKSAHNKDERFRRMRQTLFTASLKLGGEGIQALAAHKSHAKVSRILVACSSPWSHTIKRNISYNRDTPFEVTQSLVSDLVESAEEQAAEILAEDKIVQTLGFVVIERTTVDIETNGYSITKPYGKFVTSISLAHLIGLVPQDVLDAVHEVQDKILTNAEVHTHTYMLIMYCVLRDVYPEHSALCIVDITGESTEIGIVKNGVLSKTSYTPYGSNTLLRDIEKQTGTTQDDIVTSLRALGEETASKENATATNILLSTFDAQINSILSDLHKTEGIPNTLVVTALPDLQSLFVKRIPQIAHSVTSENYTALELNPSVLDKIAKNKNSDVFISLASRFFHKLHGCGEIESI